MGIELVEWGEGVEEWSIGGGFGESADGPPATELILLGQIANPPCPRCRLSSRVNLTHP